jgi:hypothetical protein
MPQSEKFEVLVLGQWDGRQAYRLAHGAIGTTNCHGGATLGWWLLSQYRLHAKQE